MDSSDTLTASHPVVAALTAVADVDQVFALPEWTQDTAVTAATTAQLVALQGRLAALTLRNLSHAATVDVAGAAAASSTANWLAHATRTTRRDAHRQSRLATALERVEHSTVRDALASGRLRVDQAQVIVTAVDALPDDLDVGLVAQAQGYLLGQADSFDADRLKVLGDKLLDVVAPEIAEAVEAKRLADQERRAAEKTRLTMNSDGQGSVFVRATLPDLHAAMLKKILLAYAAPKHQAATTHAGATAERRPSPERMGRAFCDLLECLTDVDLPKSGGTGATVVVTMDLATLTGGLAAAHLDTGQPVSPGTARRLACQAGLVPAVLGGPSNPLDLGRKTRFHTESQRLAIALRDGGCTADGCDWPPGMCQSITTLRGAPAASPISTTPGCSAPTTTPGPTTPAMSSPSCPTAGSASIGGPEERWHPRHRSRLTTFIVEDDPGEPLGVAMSSEGAHLRTLRPAMEGIRRIVPAQVRDPSLSPSIQAASAHGAV